MLVCEWVYSTAHTHHIRKNSARHRQSQWHHKFLLVYFTPVFFNWTPFLPLLFCHCQSSVGLNHFLRCILCGNFNMNSSLPLHIQLYYCEFGCLCWQLFIWRWTGACHCWLVWENMFFFWISVSSIPIEIPISPNIHIRINMLFLTLRIWNAQCVWNVNRK